MTQARGNPGILARMPFADDRSRAQLAALAFLALWIVAGALAWGGTLFADEWVHFLQISRFRVDDLRIVDEYLTTIPGYHALMAFAMRALGVESLGAARLLNSLFGVAAIIAFHRLRSSLRTGDAGAAAIQFGCLPILVPLFFLVYTDAASLALVLAAAALALDRHHRTAALVLVAAMCMRQNNVLWIPFVAALGTWPEIVARPRPPRAIRAVAALLWPYFAACLVFVAYWLWHGSVSWSKAQATHHPDARFFVGNLYFTLVLFAVLLPLHVGAGLSRYVREIRARPWLLALPATLVAVYALAFRVDHPFNFVVPELNLRNRLLSWVQAHAFAHAAFGLVATLAGCALAMLPLVRREALLLFPSAVVFLGTSWLIEQRYALIPLAFWLALRTPLSPWIERVTTLAWGALALVLCWGIFDLRFFL